MAVGTMFGPASIEETSTVPYAYVEGYGADISCAANDPRMSGTLTAIQNFVQLAPGLEGGYVRPGTARLVADGGTWLVEFMGSTQPGTSAYTGNTYSYLYTGEGDLTGLSAMTIWLSTGMGLWDTEGVLFPGPIPEFPSLPEPAE